MSDAADLQRARDAVSTSLDGATRVFQEELAAVWRRLDRQMTGLVQDAAGGSTSAIIRAARAGRLRKEIQQAFERAGWDHLIADSTGPALDVVLTDVEALRLVADLEAFTGADAARLEALKALAGADVLGEGEQIATTLWKATVNGVFSSRPVTAILDDLGTVLDVTAPHVRTLYDTSVSVFARQAESLGLTDDAARPYVYTGPNDRKVRPFCRAHLGMVYTKTAIDALDNGQLPNCYLTGGGYNCRHGWTAVSKFSELAALVNTGARVPEFSRGISDGGAKAA